MMKFAAFENIVNALYANVVPKPKSECSKTEQLGVSFAAGYLAGALPQTWPCPAQHIQQFVPSQIPSLGQCKWQMSNVV